MVVAAMTESVSVWTFLLSRRRDVFGTGVIMVVAGSVGADDATTFLPPGVSIASLFAGGQKGCMSGVSIFLFDVRSFAIACFVCLAHKSVPFTG